MQTQTAINFPTSGSGAIANQWPVLSIDALNWSKEDRRFSVELSNLRDQKYNWLLNKLFKRGGSVVLRNPKTGGQVQFFFDKIIRNGENVESFNYRSACGIVVTFTNDLVK